MQDHSGRGLAKANEYKADASEPQATQCPECDSETAGDRAAEGLKCGPCAYGGG